MPSCTLFGPKIQSTNDTHLNVFLDINSYDTNHNIIGNKLFVFPLCDSDGDDYSTDVNGALQISVGYVFGG